MRVFLTGVGTEEEVLAARTELEERGHEVVTSDERRVEAYGSLETAAMAAPQDLLRLDVQAILEAQGVALLPGWRSSKAAKVERLLSVRLGLVADDVEAFTKPGGIALRRTVYQCSVCGADFTRGRGRPPKVLLCPEHDYLKPSARRASADEVIEPPDRTGTGYDERVEEFWAFARERHSIYLKRQAGVAPPWTADPLMATRFFTNVYRGIDPGTLAFRKWVEARPDRTVDDVAFWSLAYRATNHEDLLERRSLPDKDPKSISEWVSLLRDDERAGYQVQPSTHRAKGYQHMRAALTGATFDLDITAEETAEDAWWHVKSFYGLGPFYATQVLSDVLDDETSPWPRDSYIPTALGSTRALFWLSKGEQTKSSAISSRLIVTDLDFAYRDLEREQPDIGGPRLTFVDVEHTLCEFSKYLQAKAGETYGSGKLRVFSPSRASL